MNAMQAAYEATKDRLTGIGFEQFTSALLEADVHPVHVDGEIVGAVIVSGPDIHACVAKDAAGRWFNRRMARILNDVIAEHGFARTSATTPAGREFVIRLGFEQRGDDWVKDVPYGH